MLEKVMLKLSAMIGPPEIFNSLCNNKKKALPTMGDYQKLLDAEYSEVKQMTVSFSKSTCAAFMAKPVNLWIL